MPNRAHRAVQLTLALSAVVFAQSRSQAYKYYSHPEAEEDNFGVAVALDGAVALASVEQDGTEQTPKSGSVFAFDLVTPHAPVPALGRPALTWILAGAFLAFGIYSSRGRNTGADGTPYRLVGVPDGLGASDIRKSDPAAQ
jgi:hypothetical protein